MGYKYEYEYMGYGPIEAIEKALTDDDSTEADEWKCTIYDEDTGEELAVGYGFGKKLAREDAESNL